MENAHDRITDDEWDFGNGHTSDLLEAIDAPPVLEVIDASPVLED
jgi:hypothetical protein